EGPGLAVRAVLPALGELRLHLRGARLETDQPLHDLPGDPEGLPVGGVERVEQVGGTRCTEGEGAAFAGGTVPLGLRTSRQRRQQRQSDTGGHQSAARPRTRRHPGSPHSTTSVVTGSESAVRLTRKRPSGRGSGVTTWFPGSAEQSTRSLQAGRTRHRSGPRSGGKSPKPASANRKPPHRRVLWCRRRRTRSVRTPATAAGADGFAGRPGEPPAPTAGPG